jgi:hypothetical protein
MHGLRRMRPACRPGLREMWCTCVHAHRERGGLLAGLQLHQGRPQAQHGRAAARVAHRQQRAVVMCAQ